jgi:hypothetical protein
MRCDTQLPSIPAPFSFGVSSTAQRDDTSRTGENHLGASADTPCTLIDRDDILRDIVAIANSGGGRLVVAGDLKHAEITTLLASATQSEFADVRVSKVPGGSAIEVGSAEYPLCFQSPVHLSMQQQEGATQPTVYVWRDGRAEPATTADMWAFYRRSRRRFIRQLIRGVRQSPIGGVLAAPAEADSLRGAHQPVKASPVAQPQPVRIVMDPAAPALHPQDVERLYPLRQTDLVKVLNRHFGRRFVNGYDIQAVRRQHRLDERPDFIFHLPGAGRRYSHAAAEWIASQFEADAQFFRQARAADQETLKLRRRKPR